MTGRNKLGKDLRSLRENVGLGIKTVGKNLKISYSHISKVENGHKPPSPELLTKLAELYGIDPDEMLARVGALPPDIQELIQHNGKEVFEIIRQNFGSAQRTKKGAK
jgi:transcriptional regulator with XRE-family HTH domain